MAINGAQRDATIEIYNRYMGGSDAQKSVMNSPCVDRYSGKCLSKDNSKAVLCDRFGRPKTDKKRKGGPNGNGGDGGSKAKKSNKGDDGKKGKKVFLRFIFYTLTRVFL